MKRLSLSNNQLKIIGLIAMTVDHMGLLLFPQQQWMRGIGRLAYPIFAFMIAQGCLHTRSMGRYLLSTAAVAFACQVVDLLFRGSLYQCIMVTFSLSIALIWCVKNFRSKRTPGAFALALGGFAAAFAICVGMPQWLQPYGFEVDYGIIGVLIPVAVYLCKEKEHQLWMLTAGLCALAYCSIQIQGLALLAVPLLLLYNGSRGKRNLKWFFYLYYPLHLVAIYLAGLVL